MTETAQQPKTENLDQLKVELAKEMKAFTDKWERKLMGTLVPGDKTKPLVQGFRNETTVVPLARLQLWVENQVNLLSEQQRQGMQGFWQVLQQVNNQITDARAGELALDIKTEALQRLANIESKALEAMMDVVAKEREAEVEAKKDEQSGRKVVDRAAADGDVVKIDFVGSVDGKEFQGGKASNHHLTLGTKTFIAGFEEGIVGMKAGDVKDLNVKFPDDYGSKDLAGKDAVFKVTLLAVKEVTKKEESSEQQQTEEQSK